MSGGPTGNAARVDAPLRVAIVADLLSECWPSMDLVANQLYAHLRNEHGASMHVDLLRPELGQRDGLQRYVTRYWRYANWLRPRARDFDVFHVVDHSYAHLVHVLPAARTVVTCHDTDAFMPLVSDVVKTRLPRFVTRYVLSGMRKAASIICVSEATRDELRQFGFADQGRTSVVYNGVDPAFSPLEDPEADRLATEMIGPSNPEVVDLLHVGSNIPRKRIDVLLRVFRAVRDREPRARLLKAGGRLSPEQQALARELGVDSHIAQLPFLDTRVLAAVYRRAAAVLVPSEREGFGLPVVEALAAGAPVVATDLPVFREIGADAVRYAELGDVPQWADEILRVVRDNSDSSTRNHVRSQGVSRAASFSWSTYARLHADTYRHLASTAQSR